MTTDVEGIVRAAAEEFVHSRTKVYKKGKGMNFFAFCLKHYPLVVIFSLARADLGTRADSATESAVALYMNRKVFMHFLRDRIASSKDDNKLERCLFTLLGSIEIIAAVRCRAIIHLKVIEPLHFFANDSELSFSPVDMGPILDAV